MPILVKIIIKRQGSTVQVFLPLCPLKIGANRLKKLITIIEREKTIPHYFVLIKVKKLYELAVPLLTIIL